MAQDGHIVYQKCPTCDGTGINDKFASDQYGVGSVVEDTCPNCNGDKYVLWGWMTKDDLELPDYLPE